MLVERIVSDLKIEFRIGDVAEGAEGATAAL